MDKETATAILEKYGLKPGDRVGDLRGSHRAQVKTALNWFRENPPATPKKRRRTKKTDS